MTDIGATFRKPFDEQAAFFRQKLGNLVPTEKWVDMQKSAHDTGFMVAGAQSAELLTDLAAAVDRAIVEGRSLKDFRQNFKSIVAEHGWAYQGDFNWRTKVIYQTNMLTSYAAGRLAQLRESDFSHWTYIHSKVVAHPRKEHLAWDGLTLKADDPWWQTHYPPNGWGCQCRVKGTNRPKGISEAPKDGIDPGTGEPTGIDKGWGYMPGHTVSSAVTAIADKLPKLPAPIGAAMTKLWSERDYQNLTDQFGTFVDGVISDGFGRGKNMVIGAMKPEWLDELQKLGVSPETAEIVVTDKDLWHTFRDAKNQPLPIDWYKELPQHIRKPEAVFLDESHARPALLMWFDITPTLPQLGKKMVLQLDFDVKKHGKLNTLGTGGVVGTHGVAGQKKYKLISGSL